MSQNKVKPKTVDNTALANQIDCPFALMERFVNLMSDERYTRNSHLQQVKSMFLNEQQGARTTQKRIDERRAQDEANRKRREEKNKKKEQEKAPKGE